MSMRIYKHVKLYGRLHRQGIFDLNYFAAFGDPTQTLSKQEQQLGLRSLSVVRVLTFRSESFSSQIATSLETLA